MAKNIKIVIEGDGEAAKRALEMVRDEMKETAESAKHQASEMAEAMERVKRALEFTGIYLGLEEIREVLKELVTESLEFGETISDAAKQTGISATTLSVLHQAAAITGTEFGKMTAAVSKMDATIASAAGGNKTAQSAMKALGLNAKELADRTDGAEVAFQRFVQVLGQTENPIRRVELAKAMLGKAGADLVPVLLDLAEGYEGFEKSARNAGTYLDQEAAEHLEELNHKLKEMKTALAGAGVQLMSGMTPALEEMFKVIGEGKSSQDTMREWGQVIGQILADVMMVSYFTASGIEAVFAVLEGGSLTEAGRRDLAASEQLLEKAKKFRDYAESGYKQGANKSADEETKPKPLGRGGFKGIDHAEERAKSDDPIVRAAAELVAEQAKAASDARKSAAEQALAELEANHKTMLVSDGEFYEQKLRLQNDALDAEADALRSKENTLQDLLEKQKGDKLLKRGKDGKSAEELKTQREMLQVQEQLNALATKRVALQQAEQVEVYGSNAAAELQTLRLAADLERERNDGIEAQIALIKRKAELDAQKVKNSGGTQEDTDAAIAAGDLAAKKLRIEDINRRIAESENATRRSIDDVNDSASKGYITQQQAKREINRLNLEEADSLRTLVAEYDALAAQLGGQFIEKAKDLHEQLDKLGRPDRSDNLSFAKLFSDGMTEMAGNVSRQAAQVRGSFRQMASDVLQIVGQMAIKLATQKWLTPWLSKGAMGTGAGAGMGDFGGDLGLGFGATGLPGFATGTDNMTGPAWVGEAGPEIWMPPQKGGSVISNDTLKRVAENGGGGGKAPSITQNIVNQTRQPVTAQQPSVSYDSQLRQFVIQTVLTDHEEGGPMSQIGR